MIPAPVMTKKVVIQFAQNKWSIPGWHDAAHSKYIQLVSEGKAVNTRINPYNTDERGPFVGLTNFIDQAAAEEWVAFITELDSRLNRGIISAVISDL